MKRSFVVILSLVALSLAVELTIAASTIPTTITGGGICHSGCYSIYAGSIWQNADQKLPAIPGKDFGRVDSPVISDNNRLTPSDVQTHSYAQLGKVGAKVQVKTTYTPYEAIAQSIFVDSIVFSGPSGQSAVIPFRYHLDGYLDVQGPTSYGLSSFYYDVLLGDSQTGTDLWFDPSVTRTSGGTVPVIYDNWEYLTIPFGKEITIIESLTVHAYITEPDHNYQYQSGNVDINFLDTAWTQIIPPSGVTARSTSGFDYSRPVATPEPSTLMLIGSTLLGCYISRRLRSHRNRH